MKLSGKKIGRAFLDVVRSRWASAVFEVLFWGMLSLAVAPRVWYTIFLYPLDLFKVGFWIEFGSEATVTISLIIVPLFVNLIFGVSPLKLFFARVAAQLKETQHPNEVLLGHETSAGQVQGTSANGNKPSADPETALFYLKRNASNSTKIATDSLRRASVHLLAGVSIGAIGLVFFFAITSRQPSNVQVTTALWPSIAAGIANLIPRFGILLFIELTAAFFLRQYRVAMEEFRYFESIQRQREGEIVAYLIRKEHPQQATLLEFAKALERNASPMILRQGETTPIIETQKATENEVIRLVQEVARPLEKLVEIASKKVGGTEKAPQPAPAADG